MSMKNVKCPHCGYEFDLNISHAVDKNRSMTLRFMGIHKPIGPMPKFIKITCKNKSCGRGFTVKV